MVARAGSWERSYVTADAVVFSIDNARVTGPITSPSDSLPGSTLLVARMALSIFSKPAPCRCTWSKPAGKPPRGCGSALFCRSVRTCWGATRGLACSSNATAPATCGDAIDVPLRIEYPPSSNG